MPSCEWLDFTQKFLQTNLKNTADLLLPCASRCLLKCNVILAYFAAYFGLVVLSTGSNYASLLAQFLGYKLETFP